MNERELIDGLKRRDRKAQQFLFNSLHRRLCSIAIGIIRSRENAEDIVQDKWLEFFKRVDHFDKSSSIEAFMFISVRNGCFSYLKKKKIRKQHDPVYDSDTSVDQWIKDEDIWQEIEKYFEKIPDKAREVLFLRLEDFDYSEVAQKMGITPQTARNHYSNALACLRRELIKRGMIILLCMLFIE